MQDKKASQVQGLGAEVGLPLSVQLNNLAKRNSATSGIYVCVDFHILDEVDILGPVFKFLYKKIAYVVDSAVVNLFLVCIFLPTS